MYARDKVRPKLYDLDSEKLSRLFADLRRESAATGSFPITVRHLESMIRMAEASARMSLREYVRADDIDLAISVAVESFVNAQKMSIKKTLQRVRFYLLSPFFLLLLVDDVLILPFFGATRASANISPRPATTKSCSRSCWDKS
jgi:MCM AAA-lid domain